MPTDTECDTALNIESDSDTLSIVIVGGGPIGQIVAITLAEYLHKSNRLACIRIYEPKWRHSEEGSITYRERKRNSQVIILQDEVMEKLPYDVIDALFIDEKACERVWPASWNIPIQEIEDRLLVALNKWKSEYVELNLKPQRFDEQELKSIEGSLDILVGADGSHSFVREYFNFDTTSLGVDYALEVEFDLDEPTSTQAEIVNFTMFQVRYLVNSLFATRGLLNIRLSKKEYEAFAEFKERSGADFDDLFTKNDCVKKLKDFGLLWLHTVVQDGLHLFNIPEEKVKSINLTQTDIGYPTECWKIGGTKNSQYHVYIIDSASCIDVWPIRRLNSGIKASIALSDVLAKRPISKDFSQFTKFMNTLTQREQHKINMDDCIESVMEEQGIDIAKILSHYTYTIPYIANSLTTRLVTNAKELDLYIQIKSRLSSSLSIQLETFSTNTEWPPTTLDLSKDMIETALGRIQSGLTLRILEKCGSWPINYITDDGLSLDDFDIPDPIPQSSPMPQDYTPRPKIALIPGLYLLIEIIKESSAVVLVDKPIFRYDNIETLCNDLAPGTYHSKSDIDFDSLNRCAGMQLMGCYGKKELIVRWLRSVDMINEDAYNIIVSEMQFNGNNGFESYFRPGIYFLKASNREDLGVIFFWPEDTSFEKDATDNTVKNTENCIRYLTQLTLEQVCLMSSTDIKNLQLEESKRVPKKAREAFSFKVKETQCQKDEISFEDGFSLSLALCKHSNQSRDLEVMIVENDSMPYVATLLSTPIDIKETSDTYISEYLNGLQNIFKQFIHEQNRRLLIGENIDFEGLFLLLNGLEVYPEQRYRVLSTLYNAIDKKRSSRMMAAFWRMVPSEVKDLYKKLDYTDYYQDLSVETEELSNNSHVTRTIESIKNVMSFKWKQAKKRFAIAMKIRSIRHDLNLADIFNFSPYNTDGEEVINYFIGGSQEELSPTEDIADNVLLNELFSSDDYTELQKIFSDLYQEWKLETFKGLGIDSYSPGLCTAKNQIPSWATDLLNDPELKDASRKALIAEFDNPTNEEAFKVVNIIMKTKKGFIHNNDEYEITYNYTSITPPKTEVTLYETNLTQDDIDQLRYYGTDSHLIIPTLPKQSGKLSFDPKKRILRKIICMPNRKYIAFFWNYVEKQTEIYLRSISPTSEFSTAIEKGQCEMKSNDDYTMFAWDHLRGLLACCSPEGHICIRNFDPTFDYQNRSQPDFALEAIYKRQISLAHFFWIPGRGELCIVESDGQTCFYDTATQCLSEKGQFSPSSIDFDTIFGSPDGACIIGLSKVEQAQHDLNSDFTTPDSTNLQAHVHFYEHLSLSSPVKPSSPIIVALPVTFDLGTKKKRFFKIALDGKQFQIIYIDHDQFLLQSFLVKIKTAKSSFCIQQIGSTIRQATNSTFGTNAIDYLGRVFVRFPVVSAIRQSIENENREQESIQSSRSTLYVVIDTTLDDLEQEKYDKNVPSYIRNMWKKLGTKTSKPVDTLNNNYRTVVSSMEKKNIMAGSKHKIGDWMIRLISLLPIQIGLCKNNQFTPVKDGTDQLQTTLYGSTAEAINAMSFGLYEAVIRHFKGFEVKVLSSMGEQSTGKSYMMNHILGTSFDGDARRTTEGVWMSLAVVQEERLIYLGLDFEAISSSERTTQEDTFLSLFNACISDLIIFKSMPSLNRDIIYMFERFQESVKLISDETIFKAILAIVIRDTDTDNDEQSKYQKEYINKISEMVQKNQQDNWVTKLYSGDMKIYPWPQFRQPEFYEYMEYIVEDLRSQQRYDNGSQFLDYVKVVMGKLMTKDWGTINNNLIPLRIKFLRLRIKCAIENGVASLDPLEPLQNHETGITILQNNSDLDDFLSFDRPDSKGSRASDIPADSILKLRDDDTYWDKLLEPFHQLYENLIMPREASSDDNEWVQKLSEFIRLLVERRKDIVKKWEDVNLVSRFVKDKEDHRIREFQDHLDGELKGLKKLWTICGRGCSNCQLRCLLRQGHQQQHDCLTDHKCHKKCTYEDFHYEQVPNLTALPLCQGNAGHSGTHVCNTSTHICGKICHLYGRLYCQQVCAKTTNHQDSCQCQTSIHLCGEPCSLVDCDNRCIEPYESDHYRHHCDYNKCPRRCRLCSENCNSNNHFHGIDTKDDHYCGREHNCKSLCQERGICHVETEPQRRDMIFKNDHQSFTYTKHIQISKRLPCAIKIPANKPSHEGTHRHKASKSGFHYCDKRCPYCDYFCTLRIDHRQKLHSTSHGNMNMAYFVSESDADQFEFEGRTVKPGDSTTFLMCTHFCSGKGRHRHIHKCMDVSICKNQKYHPAADTTFKHIWNALIRPNPKEPKDYVTHRRMWDLAGFQDPYANSYEETEFKLCDFECNGEEHKGKDRNGANNIRQFCQLSIFHPPLSPSDPPPGGKGYISADGHHFICDNPLAARYHVIFVTDRSSSMGRNLDSQQRNYTPSFANIPNNRYGAVIIAVKNFIDKRNSRPTSIARRLDRYSLVLFDGTAKVAHEYILESESEKIITKMLSTPIGHGTSFKHAINEAKKIAVKDLGSKMHTVIIFLSDGEACCPEEELLSLCENFGSKNRQLTLYTVLFNNENRGEEVLNEMAFIAAKYAPATHLQSGYFRALDDAQLSDYFVGLASGMRKVAPTFMPRK